MATIKGEIPPELEERFRDALKGKQKGAVSKALREAIELWLEKHEQEQQTTNQIFYQKLLQEHSERFIILDKKTKTVLAAGNEIIGVTTEAKKKKPGSQLVIVSRDHFPRKTAQLGLRTKLGLKTLAD